MYHPSGKRKVTGNRDSKSLKVEIITQVDVLVQKKMVVKTE